MNYLIDKLGEAGIYTLIDSHQDVAARAICGEGMPFFYANEILAGDVFCFGHYTDMVLKPLFDLSGFCKPISSFNFRKDKNGNPLIEDCQKYEFYKYYATPEAWSIFRALWTN